MLLVLIWVHNSKFVELRVYNMRFVNNKQVTVIEDIVYEGVEAVLFKKGYRVIKERIVKDTVDIKGGKARAGKSLERVWIKKNKKYGDKEHLTRAPIMAPVALEPCYCGSKMVHTHQ